MLKNIRHQLTLWYSLGILSSILVLLVLFYVSTQIVFYAQVDQTLKTHVNSLVASLEKDNKIANCGCLSPNSTLLLGVLQMPGMPTAIFDENGKVVKASVDWDLVSSDKQSYRFLKSPIKNNGRVIGSIIMGHPIDAFLKTRSILMIFIIIVMVIIFIPIILLGRFLAQKALLKEKEFLTNMAHSLKTPLSVLQSQLESQADKSSLLTQVKQISSVVNETLETAYGQSSLDKNSLVNLNDLVEETTEICEHLSQKKKIKVISNLVKEKVFVKGQKQNLAKAILAIIENAVKYTKTNGQIEISLARNNNEAIVTITDSGIGIEKSELPFVFKRFYRGKNQKLIGHGLGLPIAKNIIEDLNGKIELDSKIKRGTTAIISLPTA